VELARLVALSSRVAKERGRNAKAALIAELLRELRDRDVRLGVSYCAGEVPQGKVGVGYATLRALAAESRPAAEGSTLSLLDVDDAITELASIEGAGSARRRRDVLAALLARATEAERGFVVALLVSELRQGSLASSMLEAAALASGIEARALRRAAMLAGSEVEAATVALTEGAAGLARFALTPFVPVLPMLASPCADPTDALSQLAEGRRESAALFELKLDGARVQVHRDGEVVRVWSRAMNEVTDRVPEVVRAARAMPARRLILDGEAIALRRDGSPEPFQVTMKRFGRTKNVEAMAASLPLTPVFFDVMLLDDEVLLDVPLVRRREILAHLVGAVREHARLPTGRICERADEAERFYADVVAEGHEGLMAKSLEGLYEAGHRGSAWLKIKPAHTLDLVVLAVERGSGRRSSWLSNIHLGARDPSGGFAMVGKTFKGMTDAMLAWQTARFTELAREPDSVGDPSAWVVALRPEQVVEVALSGVQVSPEYGSGLALRFARVRRYRDDKRPEDASTLDEVRALLPK
jgi:DNA ligase-1